MEGKTSKIGQLWTDSVAYVALLVGAGLSIAGNVANVVRVRGHNLDNLDIVLAVAFPALVVLMVEVFVSARWRGLPTPMQWLRWAGCLSIGVMAMRVSWVHLNELMVSRDQTTDVAIIGPLAIDALAIMATALILAGRGQARPAVTEPTIEPTIPAVASREEPNWLYVGSRSLEEAGVAEEASSYLARLSGELDSQTTPAHPVSPAPMTNAVKPESVPDTATDLILAWHAADAVERPTATQVNEALAAWFDVSPRTGRRWVSALKGSNA